MRRSYSSTLDLSYRHLPVLEETPSDLLVPTDLDAGSLLKQEQISGAKSLENTPTSPALAGMSFVHKRHAETRLLAPHWLGGGAACGEGVSGGEREEEKETDEDSFERYIRKTLHKVRTYRDSQRNVNLFMRQYVYWAYNFNLNGKILKRIALEVHNGSYRDINPNPISDVSTIYNAVSGRTSTGFTIDNKISFYFDNDEDKKWALEYITWIHITDDFVPAFKHFNVTTLDQEIQARQANPNLINQAATSLCGVACVVNIMAKNDPQAYESFVKDLYFYGEAFYEKTSYLIHPRNSVFKNVYEIKPTDASYPKNMPQADYIALSSIKCSENSFFSFDGQQDWKPFGQPIIDGLPSMTTPSEMVTLLNRLLNIPMKDLQDKTSYTSFDVLQYFNDMDADYQAGYTCFMLISMGFMKNQTEKSYIPEHWITYQGNRTTNVSGAFVFDVFTWGYAKKTLTVSPASIEANFFGYVKALI